MDLSKLKDLFLSSKKVQAQVPEESKKIKQDIQQNVRDKAQIEQYKKMIQEKLHDPQMTKKAAQIITSYLDQKSNKKAS